MKKYSPFFVLLTLMASPVWAQDGIPECTNRQDIPVRIRPRFDNPYYDYAHDIPAVQAMASGTGHSIHENLTLGLTQYEPFMEVSMPVVGVKLSNGVVCGHIQRADIGLGYKDVTISIARDVPQGTCGFKEIMAHEFKHIAVNEKILDEYIPRMQDEVGRYVRENGYFQTAHQDVVLQQIKQGIQNIIEQQMNELEQENRTLQQQVDTPEEYRRVSTSCNGELGKLTLHYLNGR